MNISVAHVTKRFGGFTALDDVTLEVPDGAILALLGPSGSGKTTLLRIIGGLEVPDSGTVFFGDADMTDRLARERNAGFVFQHYALFRNMTVLDNIGFGLKMRGASTSETRDRVAELLRLVGLLGLEGRYPSELSGGQRQRVALARALAVRPKVLLLDEPFGALDATVRTELRRALRDLHDRIQVTTILVTHDQEEAFEVADVVVVMRQGRMEQQGRPRELYERPNNPFVMDFIGQVNVAPAVVQRGWLECGRLKIECPEYTGSEPRPARLYFRANEADLIPIENANGDAGIIANVAQIRPLGALTRVQLSADDPQCSLQIDLSSDACSRQRIERGDAVLVFPNRVRVWVETREGDASPTHWATSSR